MKIAVLTNDYPPAKGGAGVITEIQVEALKKLGHNVTVFHHPPTFLERGLLSRLFAHLGDLNANKELVTKIKEAAPDALLTHNLTGCGIGTPRAVKNVGIPWLHIIHDVQLVEPSGHIVVGESFSILRAIWRSFWAGRRRSAFGSPNVVISPTRWLLNFHRRYGFFRSSQTEVIPNPLPHATEIADSHPAGERNMLYVGRIDADKGVTILLEAWKALGEDRPQLTLVGEGGLREKMTELKEERLIVAGPKSHDEILALMKQNRVLVVPSLLVENQPTVILEGLLSGCEIVASDVGGIPETLGKAGWIVPAKNVSRLTEVMREAISSTPDANREMARYDILKRHRVDVVVEALESLLKSKA